VRDRLAPTVPVLVLAPTADETRIAAAMALGRTRRRHAGQYRAPAGSDAARAAGLSHRAHARCHAEIRAEARSQLGTVLYRSNDAIIQVQEESCRRESRLARAVRVEAGIAGEPVMDLFEDSTHAALRGALAACLQGRWEGGSPVAGQRAAWRWQRAAHRDDARAREHEEEPCVSLMVPSRPREERLTFERHSSAAETGGALLPRPELLQALAQRLATPAPEACRCIALIKLDKFADLERVVGATASEDILVEFARLLKDTLHPKELAGRFSGVRFLVLLERGNEHDINAWASGC